MACPRELPERKAPREESEASEEESPNKGTLAYKQKKQLLVDCLTNIIRYWPIIFILLFLQFSWPLSSNTSFLEE